MSFGRRLSVLCMSIFVAVGLLSLLWGMEAMPIAPASASVEELITNGDFSSGEDWAYSNGATYDVAGQWVELFGGDPPSAIAQWSEAPTSAGVYQVTVDCYVAGAYDDLILSLANPEEALDYSITHRCNSSGWNTFTETHLLPANTYRLTLQRRTTLTTSSAISVDNVSLVRLRDPQLFDSGIITNGGIVGTEGWTLESGAEYASFAGSGTTDLGTLLLPASAPESQVRQLTDVPTSTAVYELSLNCFGTGVQAITLTLQNTAEGLNYSESYPCAGSWQNHADEHLLPVQAYTVAVEHAGGAGSIYLDDIGLVRVRDPQRFDSGLIANGGVIGTGGWTLENGAGYASFAGSGTTDLGTLVLFGGSPHSQVSQSVNTPAGGLHELGLNCFASSSANNDLTLTLATDSGVAHQETLNCQAFGWGAITRILDLPSQAYTLTVSHTSSSLGEYAIYVDDLSLHPTTLLGQTDFGCTACPSQGNTAGIDTGNDNIPQSHAITGGSLLPETQGVLGNH